MRYLTPRKRAEGLGAARAGTTNHWAITVSSVALAILTPFFLWTMGSAFAAASRSANALQAQIAVIEHFSHPFPALVTALFLIVGMLHFIRGTRMTIEDYLQGATRQWLIIASVLFGWAVIAAGLFALVKMALTVVVM